MKYKRIFSLWFSIFLGFYGLIYLTLSMNGRYAPSIVGTFGVEQYQWAPSGFYDYKHRTGGLGWNKPMCYIFLPLWMFDNSYIHNERKTENDNP